MITKPALVVALLIFFWIGSTLLPKTIRNVTLLALVSSLIGDVLLMFVDVSPNYFMMGLVAFLIAHILYSVVFLKQQNSSKNPTVFIMFILAFAVGLLYVLWNGLGGMRIPVCIYMIVILTMATTAFLRQGNVSKISYNLVLTGALLFTISDGILALDKFHAPVPFSNTLIMVTYGVAQFFIVLGIKKEQ